MDADIVIIDDISMCRIDVFEYVVRTLLNIRKNLKLEGDMDHYEKQIILSGDFYRLPPVINREDKQFSSGEKYMPITYNDIVAAWQKKDIKSITDLDVALGDFRILFAYNSNKIEGAQITIHQTREIFENGKVVGYTGDLCALFETDNQRVCYEFLKNKIVSRDALTEELVLEIQDKLCHGCYDESRWQKGERPGTYKKNYYGVSVSAIVLPEECEG